MDLEQSRIEFAKIQKKITTINYVMDLLFLDVETAAPPGAATNRASTLEILDGDLYRLKFGMKTAELMAFLLEHEEELNVVEKRSLQVLKRETDRLKSIPEDEYLKYRSLLTKAQGAWHKANEENDYEIIRPYWEKIFASIRNLSEAYDPALQPYDYCLALYEPGSNSQVYDGIFDEVKSEVVPLLQAIKEKPALDDSCLKGDYSVEKQQELSLYIMNLLGVDTERVALYTSEHPFTRRMGTHFDQRITTKYHRKDFTSSLYTVLFGCGYALADMGQDDDVAYTMADGSASIGIMQGQTCFYENIVGRSRQFIELIYPKLKSLFPTSIRESLPGDLYKAINKVNASPIRISSDEITNNLHILVRYELEKALMNKELSFKDLPDAWDEKYREYLGVEAKNYTEGVLQDFPWSDASIGYYPTVVLGNAYSALMLEKMGEGLDVDACMEKGDYASINQWNREHIWKHIGLYDSYKVMEKFAGIPNADGGAYVEYLKKKYSEIYNL